MSDLALARRIGELYRTGETGVLVTVLASTHPRFEGSRFLAAPGAAGELEWLGPDDPDFAQCDASLLERLLEDCRSLIVSDSANAIQVKRPLAGEEDLLSLELIHGEPELIICGAGHVSQALAPMSRLLDMRVTVIDDREAYANRQIFPDAGIRLIVERYETGLRSLRIRPSSSVVIVTRGHHHDERCLRMVIDSPASYVGMIGSGRRVLTVFRKLEGEGLAREKLARVRAPIGLDIGSRSPAEVALSILAEIVLIRQGGSGAPKSTAEGLSRVR